MMCKSEYPIARLSACALGIAFGIVEGLFMLVYALVALYYGQGGTMIQQLSSLYPGYSATIPGALMGGLWGFIVGLIFGLVTAWIYNLCVCCCRKKFCSTTEDK